MMFMIPIPPTISDMLPIVPKQKGQELHLLL